MCLEVKERYITIPLINKRISDLLMVCLKTPPLLLIPFDTRFSIDIANNLKLTIAVTEPQILPKTKGFQFSSKIAPTIITIKLNTIIPFATLTWISQVVPTPSLPFFVTLAFFNCLK